MQVDRFWYANQTANVSAAWHYASGVFSLLSLLFGIVSNGLVVLVFIRNNELQRPRNYFLINLALTDLGLILTNNSMHVISSFRKQWIFGQIGCNFYSVCGGVFGLTSIATMALISLTRLAAVNDPFSSLTLDGRSMLNCLALAWLYGSMWILPPLFGWNRFILEGFGTSCTFDYVSKDIRDRSFIFLLITGGFVVPLIIIIVSYTFILVKLSQRNRRFLPQNNDDTYASSQAPTYYFNQLNSLHEDRQRSATNLSVHCRDENHVTRTSRRTENRATRTALLICTVFCLAWGPYALMALFSLTGFNYLVNAYTTAVLGMLTKLAACINPMIYALSLNGFREHLCSYFKSIWQCDRNSQQQSNHFSPSNLNLSRKNLANILDSQRA